MGVSLAARSPEREGRGILPGTADGWELTLGGPPPGQLYTQRAPSTPPSGPRGALPEGRARRADRQSPEPRLSPGLHPSHQGQERRCRCNPGPSLPTSPWRGPVQAAAGLGDTDRSALTGRGVPDRRRQGAKPPPRGLNPRTGPRASLPPPSPPPPISSPPRDPAGPAPHRAVVQLAAEPAVSSWSDDFSEHRSHVFFQITCPENRAQVRSGQHSKNEGAGTPSTPSSAHPVGVGF